MAALAAALSLPLLAAAQAPSFGNYWGQEAADPWRSSSIRVTDPSPVKQVLWHDLGRHPIRTRGTWPTLPSVTPAGKILMPAVANTLGMFAAPHLVVPPVNPNDGSFFESWSVQTNYFKSGDIRLGGNVAPSTTPVVSPSGVAFWANREESMMYAWDTVNNRDAWSGPNWRINMSAATTTKDGFYSYYDDFALLYYAGKVHAPDPTYHAALTVDAITGSTQYSDTAILGLGNHRLLGSTGSTGGSGSSVMYTDYGLGGTGGDNYGGFALDSDGSYLWRSSVLYDPADGDFVHPVHLSFGWENTECDIALVWEVTGLRVSGMTSGTGLACGSWQTNEADGYDGSYLIEDQNLLNSNWVSGPAVIFDEDNVGFQLFAVMDRRSTSNRTDCTLISFFVSNAGVLYEQGQYQVYRMRGVVCNSAPVALLDLWGAGQHGIALLLGNGTITYFPWQNIAGGATVSWSTLDYLPGGTAVPDEMPDYSFPGNYITATTAGSLIFVLHERGYPDPNHAFLVAIVGGHLGAPPLPAPSSSNSAATAAVDSVAAAFGTLGALAAIAAAIVWFAPTSAAAGVISSASLAVYGGVKYVASSAYSTATGRSTSFGGGSGGGSAIFAGASAKAEGAGLLKGSGGGGGGGGATFYSSSQL